jgi:hypothetical protein
VLAAAALLAGGKQAAFFAAGVGVEVVGLALLAKAHRERRF